MSQADLARLAKVTRSAVTNYINGVTRGGRIAKTLDRLGIFIDIERGDLTKAA